MQISLVMTVIGPDRPGLVESVAELVAQHGGNWLESRMARLGGQFAGVLRVQLPAESQPALTNALENLKPRGIKVTVHGDDAPPSSPSKSFHIIEIVGQDRSGIVREISHALARRSVNVEEFSSECQSAPMSGESMFHARAIVSVPANCNVAELRQELEKIGHDLIVDISVQEMQATP